MWGRGLEPSTSAFRPAAGAFLSPSLEPWCPLVVGPCSSTSILATPGTGGPL